MATIFLTTQLSNIIFASCLAAFVSLLTRFWRNPHLAHALWLLVLLKLLTPPLIQFPVPDFLSNAEEGNIIEHRADTAVHKSVHPQESLSADEAISPSLLDTLPPSQDSNHIAKAVVKPWLALSWQQWLLLGWMIGMLVFIMICLRRHLRLMQVIAESKEPEKLLIADAHQIAERLGLAACPRLRITDVHVSPLVISSWKKQIVLLPNRLLGELSRDQIKSMLAHELAHIRRRDHLVRFLEALVLTSHWWNPLAWWASRQLRQAEEECCDAWVAWALPADRRAYGRTLLQTVEFLTEQKALPVVAATPFGKCFLERRIDMILNRTVSRKLSRTGSLFVFVVAMLVLPLTFTQVRAEAPSTPTPGQSLLTEMPEDNSQPQNLADWARKHGGRFENGQLTLDIYDSQSPMYGKSNLQAADLEFLGNTDPKTIRALYLRGHKISDDGLKQIAKLTELRTLSISSNQISNEGLKHLTSLRYLLTLRIVSNQITDAGMKHIAAMNLAGIRRFDMPSSKITNAGLEILCQGNWSNLESLNLIRNPIGNAGFKQLAKLPALKSLSLRATNVNDDDVADLVALPKLRKLDLSKTKLTDRGLKALQKMASLTSLNLESTAVSNSGILQLAKMPNLMEVTLSDTSVTRTGFEKLQAINPNINIKFSPVAIVEGSNKPVKQASKVTGTVLATDQFPHVVQFEQGATRFQDGDDITIQEIRGTAATFAPGNRYRIVGTYKLDSHNKATLAAYTTARDAAHGVSSTLAIQKLAIDRGIGRFTLVLPMKYEGWPHVSFYPQGGGEGFGGNYFGTGGFVLKKWWGSKSADKSTEKAAHFFVVPVTTEFQKWRLQDNDIVAFASIDGTSFIDMKTGTIDTKTFDFKQLQDTFSNIRQRSGEGTLKVLVEFGLDSRRPIVDTFVEGALAQMSKEAGFEKVEFLKRYQNSPNWKWAGLPQVEETDQPEERLGNEALLAFPLRTSLGRYLSGGFDCLVDVPGPLPLDAPQIFSEADKTTLRAAFEEMDLPDNATIRLHVHVQKPQDFDKIQDLPQVKQDAEFHQDAVEFLKSVGFDQVSLAVDVSSIVHTSLYQ